MKHRLHVYILSVILLSSCVSSLSDAFAAVQQVPTGPQASAEALSDYSGDGKADVLLRNNSGSWYYYPMDGKTYIPGQEGFANLIRNTDWRYQGIGDMNGDDKGDVLLRHTDGRWYYYPMDGKTYIAGQEGFANLIRNTNWQYKGSGDFNGDGKDDVLLRHADGRWLYYPMDGRIYIAGQEGFANLMSNTDWQYQGIGDMNGDGKDDVLLRHTNGRWYYYPMDGRTYIAGQDGFANLVRNTDWQYQGIGDMNGDGKDGVLLRHTDGRWYYYPMDGKATIAGQKGFANLIRNTDWQYQGIGDMNGDGKDDVLLRHTDGRWYYYPMNGKTYIAGQEGLANLIRNTGWALPFAPPLQIATLTSTCPDDSGTNVGLNSWINANFDKDIDSTTIGLNSVSLDCGGWVVTGQTSVSANTIYFAPDQPIPPFQTCTVQVDPSIRDIDGVNIGSITWSFQSGSKNATYFRFDTPRSLVSNAFGFLKKVVSDGNDIAILWRIGSELYVTSSRDGGQTFTTSPPINVLQNGFGTVEELDALISNGVLHVAWRVLPVNSNAEILYSHTTTDFTTFTAPLMLTIPNDVRNAFSPSLTVNSNGELYIAWNEICQGSVFCDNDTLGVYSVKSTDGGNSFGNVVKMATYRAKLPQLATAGNQTLLALIENDVFDLYEIAPVVRLLASYSETGQQIWPYQLEEGSSDSLFIHWKEGPGIGIQTSYLSRYSSQLLAPSPPQIVARETAAEPNICTLISPASDSVIYLMTGQYDTFWSQGRRELSISTDGGNTFNYPQSLDFFHVARPASNMLSDSICPAVIPRQNGEVMLTWERVFQGSPRAWDLMVSSGVASAPCSNP